MKEMKQYMKNGVLYNILYEDTRFVLVQSGETGRLSFGKKQTLYSTKPSDTFLNRNLSVVHTKWLLGEMVRMEENSGYTDGVAESFMAMLAVLG